MTWDAKELPDSTSAAESGTSTNRSEAVRICESTGESSLAKAEEYLAKKTEEVRQAVIYGVRPKRAFRLAATKYLNENQQKRRIADTALHLKQLDPYIGNLPIESVHMGTLQPFIEARRKQGIKTKSINLALGVVRHILNLAASEWLDKNNLTWLHSPPKIKLLPVTDARKPYPLSWEEQTRLFKELPPHLARMALFKVNTGAGEKEVCYLRWEWEVPVAELGTSVFIIPEDRVKNGEERLLVLNRVAMSVIEDVRGEHPDYVFTYRGHPITAMNNSGWQQRTQACWSFSGSCPRPQAHIRPSFTGSRSKLRGSAGLVGTQVRKNHHTLLGG